MLRLLNPRVKITKLWYAFILFIVLLPTIRYPWSLESFFGYTHWWSHHTRPPDRAPPTDPISASKSRKSFHTMATYRLNDFITLLYLLILLLLLLPILLRTVWNFFLLYEEKRLLSQSFKTNTQSPDMGYFTWCLIFWFRVVELKNRCHCTWDSN